MSALMGCYVDSSLDESWEEDPQGSATGAPDFQLDTVFGPSVLTLTSNSTLRARLCNRGGSTASTKVSFFLSTDGFLDEGDAWLAISPTHTVLPGSCWDATVRVLTPMVPEGSYFMIALADPDNQVREEQENNNHRVGYTTRVDLKVLEFHDLKREDSLEFHFKGTFNPKAPLAPNAPEARNG